MQIIRRSIASAATATTTSTPHEQILTAFKSLFACAAFYRHREIPLARYVLNILRNKIFININRKIMRSQSYHLGNIVNSLGDELGVDVCSLYSLNPAGDQLILVASRGLNQSAVGARMSIKQGLTGVVARTRRSLSVKNPDTHPDYFHIKGSNEEKFQSYLGIPLIKDKILFGVLVVQTVRAKMFFMNEIEILYGAGSRVMDLMTETRLAA